MIERLCLYPAEFFRLREIRRGIYRTLAPLSVEGAVTSEPVKKSAWEGLTYRPYKKGEVWTKEKYGCAVFRVTGKVPAEGKGKEIVAILKFGAEGEVYEKGVAKQGLTPVLATMDAGQPRMGKQIYPLFSVAEGGEKVSLTVDCGNNGIVGVFLWDPRVECAEIASVARDVRAYYYDYLYVLLTLTTEKENPYLDEDGKKALQRALRESFRAYKQKGAQAARDALAPIFASKQTEGVEYTAVGHGHLDLAWKWPLREGRRKAIRTFSNALAFSEEYDFVFGASQAQMFRWVEEDEPELFARIREAVQAGRIEIQGGMWTECDCNVPSGESLIRQFLYGDRYFLDKFGVTSDVVWLPDVFGFPNTLPQIIKGVGKTGFATVKLNWNEHNKFPYQSFLWEAPDGSRVLSHISPEGTYRASASPLAFVQAEKKNVQKETGAALVIYGASDGGGGPGEGHLEMLARAGNAYVPKTRAGSAASLFERLERTRDTLPAYVGELYLEKHQGTLTSQAKNKYFNRLAEGKMHALEWLETLTEPFEGKERVWKTILTNQFHDILPGSAIERVHRESVEALGACCSALDAEIRKRIDGLSGGRSGLSALNPSPFAQRGRVKIGGALYGYDCKAYEGARLFPAEKAPVSCGADFVENEKIRVRFDLATGWIVSVTEKATGKELAAHGLMHVLAMYEDKKTRYDAWDIDEGYRKKKPAYPRLVKLDLYQTDEQAGCNLHYVVGKSVISQQIYVKDTAIIYFDTQIAWNESHKMLRANVRTTRTSARANFDAAFGSVERSTSDEGAEKAKFEVCGHFYAALGDEEKGYAAVLNDCKYGYRVKGGTISLNLLRSPTFPDPTCDRGEQSFSYAVCFADSMQEVVKEAYNYNRPVLVTDKDVTVPPAPDFGALILETIKPAENGRGIVYRAYERYGKETPLPAFCAQCTETDLEERPLAASSAYFRPHEIKTFFLPTD